MSIYGYEEYNMKSGLFYETKCNLKFNNKYSDELPAQIVRKEKSQFVVAQGSILDDIIPPFKSGGGCCNWGGTLLKCSCGNTLGEMNLDCWQDGSVWFIKENVRRSYK